ncbi:MAG: hypothetical protein ACOCW3_04155 [Spirochaetota bacterium]
MRDGRIVWQGDSEAIRAMTDEEFKEIHGEEAERGGGVHPRGAARRVNARCGTR